MNYVSISLHRTGGEGCERLTIFMPSCVPLGPGKFHIVVQVFIIIYQTHYEKSNWSRAFNQFTIICELDMINAISAADISFIMSSSTSAWLLSPLECSPQKQNDWTLRFSFWGWIMWKMYNKTIIEFGFRMISWNYQNLGKAEKRKIWRFFKLVSKCS